MFWQIPCCLFNPSQPGGRLLKLTVLPFPFQPTFAPPHLSSLYRRDEGRFLSKHIRETKQGARKRLAFVDLISRPEEACLLKEGEGNSSFLPSILGRLVSILHSGLEKMRGGRVFVRKVKTFGFSRPFYLRRSRQVKARKVLFFFLLLLLG